MSVQTLRLAVLAAAVLVVLAAGIGRPGALASPGAGEPDNAETITTVLYPGWNLVGWVGPSTPTSELFEEIPALRQVWSWESSSQRYQPRTRNSTFPRALKQVTRGMGLWLLIGGEAPVEWSRAVSDEGVLLALSAGRNLVGWTGEEGLGVGKAVARFGEVFVRASHWDASTQRWEFYLPGVESPRAFTNLSRGDGLWIDITEDTRWWQSGLGRTVFEFADEVTPEHRLEAQVEITRVITFFAERFGVYTDDLTVSMPHTEGCWARPGLMKLTDLAFVCAAHEYFHVLQYDLANATPWGPHWLVEGTATYGEEAYDGDLEFRRRIASAAASHVASLRDPATADPGRLNYHLGFLAAEWLLNRAGEASLLEYYRLLPSADAWEEAFEAAFGLSLDEFYRLFEEYRADVAPPLPHLTDDGVRPVAAFLGDVSAETRLAIRSEIESVHRFLIDRFGANPSEYSVYVGSDWDSVGHHVRRLSQSLWWDERVRRLSLPLESVGGCLTGYTGWIAYAAGCERPLDYRAYINWHLRALLQENRILDLPTWLDAGAGGYIAVQYRGVDVATLGGAFSENAKLARRSTVPLQDLAAGERWEEGNTEEHRALSILAVDFLLQRAGDQALFEYVRLLPRLPGGAWYAPAGSIGDAFEGAFGLTFEEFYEQFEAYRQTLTAE